MSKCIDVLLVDDHPLVRQGIRFMLEKSGDKIQVVGEAADGVEAIRQTRSLHPDVILLDLNMPRKTGIEVIEEIIEENPSARILVLTAYADDEQIMAVIKAGALGYLQKDVGAEKLLTSIHAVYDHLFAWPPSVTTQLVRNFQRGSKASQTQHPLSEREAEVLMLITSGLSNHAIAKALTLSEATVSTHVSNILTKLNLHSRIQAALYALKNGMVNLRDVELN